MRADIDRVQAQGEAKAQLALAPSAFKLDTATIVCSKLVNHLGEHQVRVTMHGQVANAELRLKLNGGQVSGSPWPMPNTTGNVSFLSPPTALTHAASYTIETHFVGDPNTPAYHIKSAVAPDCRLVRHPIDKDKFTPNPRLP